MSTLLPAWPTLHGNPLSDLLDELQSVYFGTRFKPKTITKWSPEAIVVLHRKVFCSCEDFKLLSILWIVDLWNTWQSVPLLL